MKKIFGESYRTTLVGILLIMLGLIAFKIHWVSGQSLFFNIFYAELPAIAIIACGWLGIHARDQKAHEASKKLQGEQSK
jgi:hypothetical protein